MADVRIALLGGFRVAAAGAAVEIPGRKTRALLAYLAGSPGLHGRDRLTALLWGETGDREARHDLLEALSILRKRVPCLLVEGDAIGLDPSAADVDVIAFDRLVRGDAPDTLEEAVSLYRGALLEGFDSGASAAFEQWRVMERERLHELAVEGLARLVARRMRAGSVASGIRLAQRLLALEPLNEPAHRALMRLYARVGRRTAALRQYEGCAEILRRDLGTEPEEETRRLYHEILQAEPTPDRGPGGTPPPPDREGPLVGRDAELDELRLLLEAAWQGHACVATIHGEAGMGKSRLAAELASEAFARGGLVLFGRAHESESVLPFRPWIDALRSGAMDAVAQTAELHAHWRLVLARLFPELGDPTTAPTDHVRLFEALTHVVLQLAADHPLLVVLEDLHWADEMTVRLLAFIARRTAGHRVLIVVTVSDDKQASGVLGPVIDELDTQTHRTRVNLAALSKADTLALVRSVTGTALDSSAEAGLGERIWTLSGGNPLVVVETARACLEAGADQASAELAPPRVQHTILRRLDRLSEPGRRLVSLAAVIGGTFEFSLLQRAANLSAREVAEGVEELVARRILRVLEDGLAFTHDLVRDLAYTRLAPPARQVLHAAVGQALEAIWAGRLEAVYDRLAFHFSRAEDADRAVEYLARFAEQAARSYAHGDAVHAVEEAVGWVDRLPSEDRDRRRLQLVLQQTSSLSFLGRFDEILEHLERERPRVERLRDAALSCAYFFRLALALNDLGDLTRSAAETQRALAEAERSGDEAVAGKARYILAQHAYHSGAHAAGVEHAWRAVALLGPKRHEAHWLGLAQWILGMNHLVLGEFPEALAAEAEAASIGHRNDDPRLQSFAASTAGWVHATRGDWHAGIEACRRGIELAPDPVSTALASARLGQAYLEQGLAADALRPLEEAIGLLVGCRFRAVNGHLTTLLGEAHLGVGRIESASELTARGLQITREAGYRYAVGWAMRALGRVRRAQADLADAEHHLAGALAVFAEIGARFEAARTRLDLAAIAQERGDPRSAAEHIADARRAFEALGVPWRPFERVHPPAECC